jgi:hemolysin III
VLLETAWHTGERPIWPIAVYCACILLLFPCSAANNLCRASPRRDVLARLDHAAIFLMIAGTYTPFTVLALRGGWALDTTCAVWLVALTGIGVKLLCPRVIERIDVAVYLGFGWSGLVIIGSLDHATAMLVADGGVLYSIGAGFHLWRNLRFHRAIWHGFVLAAALCQYAAVLHLAAAA